MSAPQWAPVDDDTADLLSVLADPHPIVGADVTDLFLAACRRAAMSCDGYVSVNVVRGILADEDIDPRRYSAMWAHFTGSGKPMVKAKDDSGAQMWETCEGSPSGNNGRPYPMRRWVR